MTRSKKNNNKVSNNNDNNADESSKTKRTLTKNNNVNDSNDNNNNNSNNINRDNDNINNNSNDNNINNGSIRNSRNNNVVVKTDESNTNDDTNTNITIKRRRRSSAKMMDSLSNINKESNNNMNMNNNSISPNTPIIDRNIRQNLVSQPITKTTQALETPYSEFTYGSSLSPIATLTPVDTIMAPTSKDWSPFVGTSLALTNLIPVSEEFQFSGHMLSPIRNTMTKICNSEVDDEPHFIRNKLALNARMTDSSSRKGEGVELFDGLELMDNIIMPDLDSSIDGNKKRGRSKRANKIDDSNKSNKRKDSVNNTSNKKKKGIDSPVSLDDADNNINTNDMTTPSNLSVSHVQPNISPTGTALKAITCNCRKSHCLKLYCDCFKVKNFCNGCNCLDCANTLETEPVRRKAMESILDRNPNAFTPRVDPTAESKEHFLGCHCKKSNCLKKYCECYSGAVVCSERCRCNDCKNIATVDESSPLQQTFIDTVSY